MKVAPKILITGGSGFVGRALIRALSSDFPEMEIHNLSPTPVDGVVNHIIERGGISVPTDLGVDFDYIVHALALSCERYCKNLDETLAINVDFTKSVLDFSAQQKNLRKFVHFSSIVLYDNGNKAPVPETAALAPYYGNYSFSKGIAEEYVRYYEIKFGLPAITVRFSNLYGPGQAVTNSPFLIPEMIFQGLSSGKILARSGKPVRDFLFIDDAVSAIQALLMSEATGIYNVGSGVGYSVHDVVETIADIIGVPFGFLDDEARGPLNFYSNIDKIRRTVGWRPRISLADGLKLTIGSLEDQSP